MLKDLLRMNIQLFAADPAGGGDPVPPANPNPSGDPVPPSEPMIPKHRFDEVSATSKKLQEEIAALKVEAEELRAQTAGLTEKDTKIAELEKQIKDIQDGYKAEKLNSIKLDIIKKRYGDKVEDFDMLVSLLNLDDIQVNKEGKVKGLAAQIKTLQESKAYLWKKTAPIVEPGKGKGTRGEKSFAQIMAEKRVAASKAVNQGKNYFK